MAVTRAYLDDDYRPEYGTLLIMATGGTAWEPDENAPIPWLRGSGHGMPGTFAAAGAGWISSNADGGNDHEVRLELHDSPPPADHAEFGDVLETPYSGGGGLSLTTLTGGVGGPDFELSDGPWFRLRISRRLDTTEEWPLDRWLLRFWPDPEPGPPVWLARERPFTAQGLAMDVESVLRWTPDRPLRTTTAELAAQLLVEEAQLVAALDRAEQDGLLHAGRGPESLTLWLGKRPGSEPPPPPPAAAPPAPEPLDADGLAAAVGPALAEKLIASMGVDGAATVVQEAGADQAAALAGFLAESEAAATAAFQRMMAEPGFTGQATFAFGTTLPRPSRRRQPERPPLGAPPRAGLVQADGTVVVWRAGERVELGRAGDVTGARAQETAVGILVAAPHRPGRLVSFDGAVTELDEVRSVHPRLLPDGHRVAVTTSEHHRRRSRFHVRVVDLAGGPTVTMPWPEDQEVTVLGVRQDTVLLGHLPDTGGPRVMLRWMPGGEPEPDPEAEARLNGPFWRLTSYPPRLVSEAGEWPLPVEDRVLHTGPGSKTVREDADHLLLAYERLEPGPAVGLRVSERDGTVEQVGAPGSTVRLECYVVPRL